MKRTATLLTILTLTITLTGCTAPSASDRTSENLSKAAENFEIDRRIVFVNGITDKYLLSIEGKCSIETTATQLEVTCKASNDAYSKHFLGLSDNVTYVAEQLKTVDVDEYRTRVIFRPDALPAPEISTEGNN